MCEQVLTYEFCKKDGCTYVVTFENEGRPELVKCRLYRKGTHRDIDGNREPETCGSSRIPKSTTKRDLSRSQTLYCRKHGGRNWDDPIPAPRRRFQVPSDDDDDDDDDGDDERWKTYTADFKDLMKPEIGDLSDRAVAESDRAMDGILAARREWIREEQQRQ